MPNFYSEMGPNFFAMALFAVVTATMVYRALRAVRWGQEARGLPLVVGLALPLMLGVYASSWQFEAWDAWVERVYTAPDVNPLAYETMKAMVLSKAIHTQLLGGVLTAAAALAVILGIVALTVEGDRPRLGVGSAGVALTFALVVAAVASGTLEGPLVLALRGALYLAGGIAATTALMSAHSRGPGVQAGTLTAVAFPLLVAGVDQAAVAAYAYQRFTAIAVMAPSPEKWAALGEALDTIDVLHSFSPLHVGLAIGLAMLGPVAAWRREPELAGRHAIAMAAGCAVCGAAVGLAGAWVM